MELQSDDDEEEEEVDEEKMEHRNDANGCVYIRFVCIAQWRSDFAAMV